MFQTLLRNDHSNPSLNDTTPNSHWLAAYL